MSLCVGLTGGIGCGKSTVADLFAKHGAGAIDTDTIAHQLTQAGGNAIATIRTAFGDSYITNKGALDRLKMRGLIFSDAAAKRQLEQLLHPLILEQTKTLLKQLQANSYNILVVPLLPESPEFQQLVQRVLAVDCSEDKQIARVTSRSGLSAPEIRAIIAQQTPRAKRLQLADDVIQNDGDLANLASQVSIFHGHYSKAPDGI